MSPLLTLCHDTGKSTYAARLSVIAMRFRLKEMGIEDEILTQCLDNIGECTTDIDRQVDEHYKAVKGVRKASHSVS
jgi:NAD+--asparagine ADP-ribosyltransferase